MNRYVLPFLILIWAVIYSWFWNCVRKPECSADIAVPQVSVTEKNATTPLVQEKPILTKEEELLFEPIDVYFESGKAGIVRNPELEVFLGTAKKYLAAHPAKKLILTGHSDSDGSEQTNLILSKNRAETIKNLLVSEGFSGDQLETLGVGEKEPKTSNDTPEGKAQNRRVSIRLMQ